ncbi:hypothetical protein [Pseudomonas asiatica]|uniref:hypothetical protein n=1 Tax=Pseudomonas asiatica TaxID=2219225 RepID=UPI003B924951
MKRNHKLLRWLSLDQALESLCSLTKEVVSEEDLISHCEEGNCGAFVQIDLSEGKALDALTNEEGEWTFQVFGVGYQRLSGPRALWANRKSKSMSVQLCGAVRTAPELEESEVGDTIWETSVPAHEQSLYFRRSQIVRLAEMITGSDDLDPRERVSVGRLIAILADLDKLDIRTTNKAARVLIAHAPLAGVAAPNKDTIAKFLDLALEQRSLR